jgi:hypothetical protein
VFHLLRTALNELSGMMRASHSLLVRVERKVAFVHIPRKRPLWVTLFCYDLKNHERHTTGFEEADFESEKEL